MRPVPAGSSWLGELTIRAHAAEIRRASEWLESTCRRYEVPRGQVERLELCLNEALANVITHGGGTALAAPITLMLRVVVDQGRGQAGVTISDSGKPFDPLSLPARTTPRTLDEAAVGGLGLIMIRRCCDWIDYRNEGGRNHLTFGARWNLQ